MPFGVVVDITGTGGAQGPQGPQGPAGNNGSNGSQGSQGPAGPPATWTDFVQDLGASSRSGVFTISGSGWTQGKSVAVVQTSQPIAAKGGATDEGAMDSIVLTGVVTNPTTITVSWNATGYVVGPYAFAYCVSG